MPSNCFFPMGKVSWKTKTIRWAVLLLLLPVLAHQPQTQAEGPFAGGAKSVVRWALPMDMNRSPFASITRRPWWSLLRTRPRCQSWLPEYRWSSSKRPKIGTPVFSAVQLAPRLETEWVFSIVCAGLSRTNFSSLSSAEATATIVFVRTSLQLTWLILTRPI